MSHCRCRAERNQRTAHTWLQTYCWQRWLWGRAHIAYFPNAVWERVPVLRDPQRRATMAAAARRTLETSFTIDRMVDEYVATYRRLLG